MAICKTCRASTYWRRRWPMACANRFSAWTLIQRFSVARSETGRQSGTRVSPVCFGRCWIGLQNMRASRGGAKRRPIIYSTSNKFSKTFPTPKSYLLRAMAGMPARSFSMRLLDRPTSMRRRRSGILGRRPSSRGEKICRPINGTISITNRSCAIRLLNSKGYAHS